jgi:4-alpha-glucanotransferase
LRQLAALAGIVPEYLDQTGKQRRQTSDATRIALLATMGVDASTPRRAAESLADWRPAPGPVVLLQGRVPVIPLCASADHGPDQGVRFLDPSSPAKNQGVRFLDPALEGISGGAARWRAEVTTEAGDRLDAEGAWRRGPPRALRIPVRLPLGYHDSVITVSAGGREVAVTRRLIVVPRRCVTPRELLQGRRCFGLIANLYTLRSDENWGVGDFSDLGALAAWAGARGADFVGVNPLHALLNRGADVSPYSPVSRLFRNPLYADVSAVPELCDAPDVLRTIASSEFQSGLAALRESANVCYEPVMTRKRLALDALHRVFEQRRAASAGDPRSDDDRVREYEAFVRAGGTSLERFATWMAIADHVRATEGPDAGADWRRWPAELRRPDSDAAREFVRAHRERVDFHCWLQFETDRQLGDAADRARRAGMAIGLYQDLAIGSSPSGADTWSHPELFIRGASVGAPPDPYAADGQNWGLPPLDPRMLRASGYEYFIKLVRAGCRHAGALRIDHAMGLFRLFWIPDGGRGADGAYVRYPADDLLGIIALESLRHGALVVGEDLGTVPPEVPPALEKRGVLSSKVLYFERGRGGGFNAAKAYKPLALATANTHDMPTLAAFVQGHDITLRRAAGLIASADEEARAREERARDIQALARRLRNAGALDRSASPDDSAAFRGAVHAFLCETPSQLVGLSLDDLAGEVEPVNLPGVGPDRFPSWTRKMSRSITDLATRRDMEAVMRCGARGR